jgi:hypothetical protein
VAATTEAIEESKPAGTGQTRGAGGGDTGVVAEKSGEMRAGGGKKGVRACAARAPGGGGGAGGPRQESGAAARRVARAARRGLPRVLATEGMPARRRLLRRPRTGRHGP